jgi:hypothetical protein
MQHAAGAPLPDHPLQQKNVNQAHSHADKVEGETDEADQLVALLRAVVCDSNQLCLHACHERAQ